MYRAEASARFYLSFFLTFTFAFTLVPVVAHSWRRVVVGGGSYCRSGPSTTLFPFFVPFLFLIFSFISLCVRSGNSFFI